MIPYNAKDVRIINEHIEAENRFRVRNETERRAGADSTACAGSEKPSYLKTSDDILTFLRSNPRWELQERQGSKFTISWWWVRDTKATSSVIHCNGNAAKAAWKRLKTASPNAAICDGGERK